MAGSIDNKNNTEVPQEEKRQKLEILGGYDGLDTSSKKAYDTLKFDTKKGGDRYTESDVSKAIGTTVDDWLAKNNLQSPEKEKAEALKNNLLSDMNGKDVKGMIESFATMRTQLMSTMATDSAKDAKGGNDFQSRKDTGDLAEKSLLDSFEDKGKSLAELFLSTQKKAQTRMQDGMNTSQKAKVQGNVESRGAQENAREKITAGWPT